MKTSAPRPRGTTVVLLPLLLVAIGAGPLAAAEASSRLRLPPDVTYGAAEGSPGPVVFSHASHVPLTGSRCVACHPALFSILRRTSGITHDEMNVGRRCGACHDGTKASGVQESCEHCHRGGGGS